MNVVGTVDLQAARDGLVSGLHSVSGSVSTCCVHTRRCRRYDGGLNLRENVVHMLMIFCLALAATVLWAVGSGTNDLARVAAVAFVPTALALYLAPAFVARHRRHRQAGAIAVLNVLLGWTLLGWAAALVWAHAAPVASAQRACPHCAEPIQARAAVCRWCGRDVPQQAKA
jgi:hypothetical protein